MESKKKVLAVVAVVVMVGAAAAVFMVMKNNDDDKKTVTLNTTSSQNQTETAVEEKKTVEVTKATDIESALAAWKTAGLVVSDDKGVYYQMVEANKGGKYDVGDVSVELYEYESTDKAKTASESALFQSEEDTVFVTGNMLVDIHSVDDAKVAPIKAVF